VLRAQAAAVSVLRRGPPLILEMPSPAETAETAAGPDAESRAWVRSLRARGRTREEAIARLHDLLRRAAAFEIARRRGSLSHVRDDEVEDLVQQSASDALMAILRKLGDYRGASRFTTWAYKFAVLEAGVKLRRRAWQGREVPLEPERWPQADGGPSTHEGVTQRELLDAIRRAIDSELTPHQRDVLVAVAINGVPIDVMAERLNTTRGALYKTLHDARRKLRRRLRADGFALGDELPAAEDG